MRPPFGEPKRKNSSNKFFIKIDEPGMVHIGKLVQKEFRPCINIVIIIKMDLETFQGLLRRRVATPFFLRNYLVEMNIVIYYFSGDRRLAIDWSDNNRFCLGQNIRIKCKALERMLRNPMRAGRKIGKCKFTCRIDLRTFKFYGE
jgi:hypothetical protein